MKEKVSRNLAETFPELAQEWNKTKNGELTPYDVSPASRNKVWWMCKSGHEYAAPIYKRVQGLGCPYDSGKVSLSERYPTIAEDWHPTLNGNLTSNDVFSGSNKKVWWKCKVNDKHEWQASVFTRTRGHGCPYCSGKLVKDDESFAEKFPMIAEEWNYEKNELTPREVTAYSNKKVWWKCLVGHEWQATINSRSRGSNCPSCAGRRTSIENSLAVLHPNLSAEWHPIKNAITPNDVTQNSNIKVWWQCSKSPDHLWESRVSNRVNGSGCPLCSRLGMKGSRNEK